MSKSFVVVVAALGFARVVFVYILGGVEFLFLLLRQDLACSPHCSQTRDLPADSLLHWDCSDLNHATLYSLYLLL